MRRAMACLNVILTLQQLLMMAVTISVNGLLVSDTFQLVPDTMCAVINTTSTNDVGPALTQTYCELEHCYCLGNHFSNVYLSTCFQNIRNNEMCSFTNVLWNVLPGEDSLRVSMFRDQFLPADRTMLSVDVSTGSISTAERH